MNKYFMAKTIMTKIKMVKLTINKINMANPINE